MDFQQRGSSNSWHVKYLDNNLQNNKNKFIIKNSIKLKTISILNRNHL